MELLEETKYFGRDCAKYTKYNFVVLLSTLLGWCELKSNMKKYIFRVYFL